jgi:hypothetical protein
MARKKRTPEERAAWEAQKAVWAEERVAFEASFERLQARWRAEAERRARRRELRRRLNPLHLLARR